MRILSLDSESWAKMGSNDIKHDLHMCTKHISDICLKRDCSSNKALGYWHTLVLRIHVALSVEA